MKLFIADLNQIIKRPDVLLAAQNRLQPNDKNRFESFSNRQRALQFLTARMIIEKFIGSDYQTLQSGKISLKDGFVSVSHCQNFVVVALSDEPVGVDIEKITNKKNFQKIAERMHFENCKTPYDFFKSWTAYEADFKCGKQNALSHTYIEHKDFLICVSSDTLKNTEIIHAAF